MVSKASDDFPDPLSPVMTVKLLRGIETSIFFRLCCRAPCTVMRSSKILFSHAAHLRQRNSEAEPAFHLLHRAEHDEPEGKHQVLVIPDRQLPGTVPIEGETYDLREEQQAKERKDQLAGFAPAHLEPAQGQPHDDKSGAKQEDPEEDAKEDKERIRAGRNGRVQQDGIAIRIEMSRTDVADVIALRVAVEDPSVGNGLVGVHVLASPSR